MKQAVFEAFIAMAITEKPPGQMSVCLNRAHKSPRKSNVKLFCFNNYKHVDVGCFI